MTSRAESFSITRGSQFQSGGYENLSSSTAKRQGLRGRLPVIRCGTRSQRIRLRWACHRISCNSGWDTKSEYYANLYTFRETEREEGDGAKSFIMRYGYKKPLRYRIANPPQALLNAR